MTSIQDILQPETEEAILATRTNKGKVEYVLRLMANAKDDRQKRSLLYVLSKADDYEGFKRALDRRIPPMRLYSLAELIELQKLEERMERAISMATDRKELDVAKLFAIHKAEVDVIKEVFKHLPDKPGSTLRDHLILKAVIGRLTIENRLPFEPEKNNGPYHLAFTTLQRVTSRVLEDLKKYKGPTSYILVGALSGMREAFAVSPGLVAYSFSAAVASSILSYEPTKET